MYSCMYSEENSLQPLAVYNPQFIFVLSLEIQWSKGESWDHIDQFKLSDFYTPAPPEGGYIVLPLSVQDIFLSIYWWQKSDIWSQASYRYAILWEASDSYFLFADLVGFYAHWTYMRGYHKWALAHSSSCFIKYLVCLYLYCLWRTNDQRVRVGITLINLSCQIWVSVPSQDLDLQWHMLWSFLYSLTWD
jgi:hypothetical protein